MTAAKLVEARNHFEVLGLVYQRGIFVSAKEVKKQFKKIALLVHPDKCTEPQAAEAFKRLNAASECLSDVSKQEAYIRDTMGVSTIYRGPMPRESSGQRAEQRPKPRTPAEKQAAKKAKKERRAQRERERQDAFEARERWAEDERERLRRRMEEMPETMEANANAWRRFAKGGKRAPGETKFHTKTSPFGHWGEFDAPHEDSTGGSATKRKTPPSSAADVDPDGVDRRASSWTQFMCGKWAPKPPDERWPPPSSQRQQRQPDAAAGGSQQRPINVDEDDHPRQEQQQQSHKQQQPRDDGSDAVDDGDDDDDDFEDLFSAPRVQRPTAPRDPVVDGSDDPTLGEADGKRAVGCYTCLAWFPTPEALRVHEGRSQYHAYNVARLHEFQYT